MIVGVVLYMLHFLKLTYCLGPTLAPNVAPPTRVLVTVNKGGAVWVFPGPARTMPVAQSMVHDLLPVQRKAIIPDVFPPPVPSFS